MAVTVLVEPQLYSPIYNSLVFTVDSTNKSQCNFRYVCDVYVNSILVASLRLYPSGANGYADFKVHRTIQDYLTFNLQNNLYGFNENDASICEYVCKFGEEYDSSVDCDAGTTVYPDLTITSSFYAWNGAMQYREWTEFDYTDFITTASTKRFLTHQPDEIMIGEGEQYCLNFLNTVNNGVYALVIETYDSNGTPIQAAEIQNGSFYSVSGSDIYRRMLSVGVGTDNLNNSTLLSGNQPLINENVSYYRVYLEDSIATVISETKQFNIDSRYTKYGANRFWWLNRLGGFDSYSFTRLSNRNVSISRTEYHKLMGAFGGTSPTDYWRYNVGDRGRTNINVDAQEKFNSNSDWLTEDEALWIEHLFTSPEAYLIDTFKQNCSNITNWACSGGDPNYVWIYVSDISLYSVGDDVYLQFDDLTVHAATVNAIGDDYIQITTACADFDQAGTTGNAFLLGFDAQLDPIIITSTAWAEKLKRTTKNIQYLIDYDKAYNINLQRN